MKNKNRIIKILIFIIAYTFLFFKIKDKDFSFISNLNIFYLLVSIALMLANWLLESKKWQIILKAINKEISFHESIISVMTGLSAGIFTPNRIGEYVGRSLIGNNKKEKTEIFIASIISSIIQSSVTLISGIFAYFYILKKYNKSYVFIALIFIYIAILSFLAFLKKENVKKVVLTFKNKGILFFLKIFSLSAIRFLIFSIQLFFVFLSFNSPESFGKIFIAISGLYFITMFIPSFFWSELGIRGSIAAYIFPLCNINAELSIIAISVIWLINIALPISISGIYTLTIGKER